MVPWMHILSSSLLFLLECRLSSNHIGKSYCHFCHMLLKMLLPNLNGLICEKLGCLGNRNHILLVGPLNIT